MATVRDSKSKTFQQEYEMGDLVQWVIDNIETTDHEIPYGGSEPALDVKVLTNHKYMITITKITERDKS